MKLIEMYSDAVTSRTARNGSQATCRRRLSNGGTLFCIVTPRVSKSRTPRPARHFKTVWRYLPGTHAGMEFSFQVTAIRAKELLEQFGAKQ